MNKSLTSLLIAILTIAFAANINAYDIDDDTLVRKGKSFSSDLGGYVDVIGDANTYDIFGMNYNISNGILRLDIFTNYPSGGTSISDPADLAIDVAYGGGSLDGKFEFGVAFWNHDGLTRGHLYQADGWTSSSDNFESKTGYWYGELWDNPYTAGEENPVVGTLKSDSATSLYDTGLSWVSTGGSDPNYQIHLEFALSALDIGAGSINRIGLFMASASCANDIMYGEVPVPIGSTALLFGTGLFGLLRFWRRRR
jgi:hypothetical protein